MGKKRLVISLGHKDLGINFPEQKRRLQRRLNLLPITFKQVGKPPLFTPMLHR